MLTNLTIIIPTFNRSVFLLRSIKYWSNYDVNVLILDGSDSHLDDSYLSNLPTNISYHFLPISFMKRLEVASSLIKTKYCILLGDDEFYIPSALYSAIIELEKDPLLISCSGQTVGFSTGKMSSWFAKSKILLGFIVYPERKGYSISQNTPRKRMIAHMTNYSPVSIYSVMRTSDWNKIIAMLGKKEIPVYAFFEIQFALAVSFLGKIKVLDKLFWLRSAENNPVEGAELFDNTDNSFERWWLDSKKTREHLELLQIVGDTLSDKINTSTNIMEYVKTSLNKYLQFSIERQLPYIVRLRINLFFSFPLKLRLIFRNIFLHNGVGMPFDESIKKMVDMGIEVNTIELLEIEKLLYKFHNINK